MSKKQLWYLHFNYVTLVHLTDYEMELGMSNLFPQRHVKGSVQIHSTCVNSQNTGGKKEKSQT